MKSDPKWTQNNESQQKLKNDKKWNGNGKWNENKEKHDFWAISKNVKTKKLPKPNDAKINQNADDKC